MEFQLSREEEMIYREAQALAGDFQQVADNLVRHHEQRLKVAEASQKRAEEAKGNQKGAVRIIGMPMMGLNRGSLLGELKFLNARSALLIQYIEGGFNPHQPVPER